MWRAFAARDRHSAKTIPRSFYTDFCGIAYDHARSLSSLGLLLRFFSLGVSNTFTLGDPDC